MSGIPAWARVGANVVFVDDSPGWIEDGGANITSRRILTLAALDGSSFSEPACQIKEWDHKFGCWTRLSRFRPLITKTQEDDVALFTPILRDADALDSVDELADLLNAFGPTTVWS